MNTIKNYFEQTSGLTFLAHSSVWNFHNINLFNVANRKGSNLNNALLDLKRNGHTGIVTLVVTQIGRSQHSESIVSIYGGVTCADKIGTSLYYSSRHDEVILERI